MCKMRSRCLSLAAAALLLLGAPLALAQEDWSADQPPAPPQTDLKPETKEKFIVAYANVQQIQADLSAKLEGVTDENKAQALQQQAQQKMMNAVENTGMSIADYNNAVQVAADNPELMTEIRQKARAHMQ